ncbi:MAG: GTP-binding protein [Porticoccaceae bacterium]
MNSPGSDGSAVTGVATNIITGFLGAGKTTAIQHLLQAKPARERWAVLVNEFGEVGIDGSLLGAAAPDGSGIFIREVPGGCMCCAAGLPMRIALNELLRRARPRRLLIEPTGLGHPAEVIATLLEPQYRGVLDLRAVITLVDPRNLADARFTASDTFNQQLAVADRIVAAKADLYPEEETLGLERYLTERGIAVPLCRMAHGRLDSDWLAPPSRHRGSAAAAHGHSHGDAVAMLERSLPECGYLRIENTANGFVSCGWIFDARFTFDAKALFVVLSGIECMRLKGVFITSDGIIAINRAEGVLSLTQLDECLDSRIEFIDTAAGTRDWSFLETGLLACRLGPVEALPQ